MRLALGTRTSRLAMAQTALAAGALDSLGHQTVTVPLSVKGDRHLTRPVAEIGGKGVFVKDIITKLLEGHIDVAVHSLKDLDTDGECLAPYVSVLPADSPYDCLVLSSSLADATPNRMSTIDAGIIGKTGDANAQCLATCLPSRPLIIGTSSPRRAAFWRRFRPQDTVAPIRGNIDRRLAQLEEAEFDATFLAKAGLDRLAMIHGDMVVTATKRRHGFFVLPVSVMLPAAGQGIIGLQFRSSVWKALADSPASGAHASDFAETGRINNPFPVTVPNHLPTWWRTAAERAFVATIEGDCHSPLGVWATFENETCTLHAAAATLDGKTCSTIKQTTAQNWWTCDPKAFGTSMGSAFRQQLGASLAQWC